MIDLTNTQYMNEDQRRASLRRAIHSQPFFNLLDFEVIAGSDKISQYGAKAQVDKDFYLTEARANYGQALVDTGSLYGLSFYIGNRGESIYKYIQGELLPTAFQVSDARTTLSVANQTAFCDLQHELMPTLIRRGDNIIARTQNLATKAEPTELEIVLSGYYPMEGAYIPARTQQGINESLADDVRFELWPVDVNGGDLNLATQTAVLNNDRFARMILGFGIALAVNCNDNDPPSAKVKIYDPYRGIRLNNVPIDVAFFAPKVNAVRDANIYYLPVEYFWQPLAPMRFDFTDINTTSGLGFQWIMLTRTV